MRWKRDSEEESESPLSIFQRGDERTGSVEEARQGGRSDHEEEEQRGTQRKREANERGGRLREGWRSRGRRGEEKETARWLTGLLLFCQAEFLIHL